jgi:hypothetical protein
MILKLLVVVSLLFTSALGARAQGPPDVIAFSSPMNIEFMSEPIAFDTEPVVGAPYSAEAVTEVVQTLADGNRIVRKNKAQIARDGQGRTRREQGFAMFGPLVNGPGTGDEPRHVQISDPTTGTMVMLDLQNRIAHKMPAPQRVTLRKMMAGASVEKFEMAIPPAGGAGSMIYQGTAAISARAVAGQRVSDPVVEQLGTTFMEGVTVEGTRTTMTIPTGQVGNEQPINIVSERWMSQDLKVLVMSRQSDPRFGETTYRLTNVSRAEPPPQLFEVPADFKMVDPTEHREMIIERKIVR